MEKTIEFHLEDFSGPLDLLLALVQKNKMSIYDIEIATLIDQYLEIVGEPENDADHSIMEANSEFITMAAHLVQMKSAMLLPRSEEADRMREELTGLLVEYSACKEIAAQLKEMAEGIFMVARKPAELQLETTYRGVHSATELAIAFQSIMGRAGARRMPRAEQFDEIVTKPFVSVTGRVIYVLRGLTSGAANSLKHLFAGSRGRSEVVATFLAVLELIRGGRIVIEDDESIAIKNREKRKTNS